MHDTFYVFYQFAMTLSLVVTLLIIILTIRRWQDPGAIAMSVLAAGTLIWTYGFFVESHNTTLEQQLFFNNIGYIGSMTVPVAWFVFAINYTRDNKSLSGWKTLALCLVPVVITALVWTNRWHHLMWSNEHLVNSGSFLVTAKSYCFFFWVALTYNYLLILSGAVILIRRLFIGKRIYTQQALFLIIAVALPLVWNVIYVFDLLALPRKDLTPATFALSGGLIVLGVLRFRLFDAIPFSSKIIIQNLNEGILVLDPSNRLLNANQSAMKIIGIKETNIGEKLEDIEVTPLELKSFLSERTENKLTCEVNGETRIFELKTVPMGESMQPGSMVILRDITEHETAEGKTKRNSMLLKAVNQVLLDTIKNKSYESVARSCMAICEELTGSKFGWIGEINDEGRMDTVAQSNLGWNACQIEKSVSTKLIKHMEIKGIWGKVIKDRQSFFTNNPSAHPDSEGTPVGHPGLTSFLGVPLKDHGRLVGMISLANKQGGYTNSDQHDMEQLAIIILEALKRKKAEENLKESEADYRNLFNLGSDAILLFETENGRILQANASATAVYGYSHDELLSLRNADLWAFSESNRRNISEVKEEKAQNLRASLEFHRKKDGKIFPVEITGRFFDRLGKSLYLAAIRDVTEKQVVLERLQLSEKNFRVSLDELPLGVRIIDASGKDLYVNQAFLDVFGYGCVDDMEETPVENLYLKKEDAAFLNSREKHLKGERGPVVYEIDIQRRDGVQRHLEIFQRQVLWNGVKNTQMFYNDITDRNHK